MAFTGRVNAKAHRGEAWGCYLKLMESGTKTSFSDSRFGDGAAPGLAK